jgi:hypothetical protein
MGVLFFFFRSDDEELDDELEELSLFFKGLACFFTIAVCGLSYFLMWSRSRLNGTLLFGAESKLTRV